MAGKRLDAIVAEELPTACASHAPRPRGYVFICITVRADA